MNSESCFERISFFNGYRAILEFLKKVLVENRP